MDDMKKAIEDALNANTELSEEGYRAATAEADKRTEIHGVEGDAPVSEEQRHARIQSNFYGTALNILMAMYSALEGIYTAIARQEEHNE